jgi:phage shock protein PspC (stress-responsive transcriptional regulator)
VITMSESTTHIEHASRIAEAKRLERSSSDRILAGVAGGLARYFDIHPAVFRVGFVVLTLLGGSGILIYAAAALVMPAEGAPDSVATRALRQRRDRPWPLIGLGLLAVAGAIVLSNISFWPHGDVWILLAIAGGLILWLTRQGLPEPRAEDERDEATALARQDSRRLRRLFKGIGIAIASLVALVLVFAAIAASVFHVHLGNGIGDREYTAVTAGQLESSYELGIGTLRLDLSGLTLPAGTTREVKARVDVGDLQVTLPSGVAVQVVGHARAGNVRLLGEESDGWEAERRVVEAGDPTLVLDARVGAGSVRVDRAVP